MKKLAIICLVALATSAYAKDMLTEIQGKWKLNAEATKAQPDVKQKIEKKDPMVTMLLGMMEKAVYDFGKDSLTFTIMDQKQVEKFTVVKNTADLLVIQNSKKENLYISKKGKGIALSETENGKPAKDANGTPTLILQRPTK